MVFCVTLQFRKCICIDTAEAGVDFISLSSTLTFGLRSPGRLCGTVAVIVDDSIAENDEDFTVFLQADSSVVVFDDSNSVVVSIINDDGKKSELYKFLHLQSFTWHHILNYSCAAFF